jgi:hypothetical protein
MEERKLHIGQLVQNAFNQSTLTKVEFARKIGIEPQNVNRHFENEDWSVIKLINAGKALNYDFSYLFELEGLKKIEHPKIILQIEVKEDNMKEVAKLIMNKDLYQIIKE